MAAITPSIAGQEKGGSFNDAPPTVIHNDYPPAFNGTQIMGNRDGEIINYKTLTWWYVMRYEVLTLGTEMLTRQ